MHDAPPPARKLGAALFIIGFLALCLFLFLYAVAYAQTMPEYRITETRGLAWDCERADDPKVCNAFGSVARFELRIDGGAWTNVGMTLVPQTTATYRTTIPPLPIGVHSAVVRACNSDNECGPESNAVQFRVKGAIPGRPTTPVVEPPPASPLVSLPRAIQLAQCYAQWAIDRDFTQPELVKLAALHPPMPVTKASVEALLDTHVPRLVLVP